MSEQKSVPSVRFVDNKNEWEKSYLYEVSERKIKKNSNNEITETLTNSAIEGIISQRDYFKKDISNVENISNYYIVEPDDFVYNPRISKNAPVGPIRRNNLGKTGIMSPLYFVFRNKRLNNKFLEIFFLGNYWHRHMFKYGNTGARADRFAIKISDLSKMKISHPSLNEQQKIGNLFEKLDQAISLQQQVLEATKDYKQSMLQKMFPKKDEEVPEIRFDKYFSPWNKIKLEKTIKKEFKGKTKESDLKKGDIEYLNTERLNGGEAYLSNAEKDVNFDDIIILWDGSKAGTVYSGFSGALGSTLKNYIIDLEFFDSSFVYQSLKKEQDRIYNQYRTPNIPHVIKDFTESFKISVPSLEEQQKIGSFFKTLDEKIEQEEKKLEAYESMKKALMQRMFV